MDFVDQLLEDMNEGSGGGGDASELISGLVQVGALTEVGAKALRKAIVPGTAADKLRAALARRPVGGPLPSPPFAQSARETERRAPLGFTEEGSSANFFTLPAVIGATTTMRAKVSRAAHVDRLLIVPSAPGAVIESIKVGDEEQVLAAGAPVELYGEPALTDTLPDNFSPIGPALDFIVTLKNTTAGVITGTIGLKASVKR